MTKVEMIKPEDNFDEKIKKIVNYLKQSNNVDSEFVFAWNLAQQIKEEMIEEFQKKSGMSIQEYFTNFLNGDTEYSEEFKEFTSNLETLNALKSKIRRLLGY